MNIKNRTWEGKKPLRRRMVVKVAGWLLPLFLITLLLFDLIPIWFILLLFVLWLLDLIPTDYCLTKDYIQRKDYIQSRGEKLLYSELQDVRSLFYWYIITDEHGDSIWIPYLFLEEDDKLTLMTWLGIDEESMAEQIDDGNGGKPSGDERAP